jgi:hypothetical protein
MNQEEFEALERAHEQQREPFWVECTKQVSPACKKTYEFEISKADYSNWRQGMFVQDAFPYLTADQRELLMTQTCGACWDVLVPPEEA